MKGHLYQFNIFDILKSDPVNHNRIGILIFLIIFEIKI